MFDLRRYLDFDRDYWQYPGNYKHQRFGQFIINNLDKESIEKLKAFLGDDYQRLYYSESYDEVNDYFMKYILSLPI